MKKMRRCVVCVAIVSATATSFADQVKVKVTNSGIAPPSGSVNSGDTLVIECEANSSCNGVTVNQNKQDVTPTAAGDKLEYTVGNTGNVTVSANNQDAIFTLGGGGTKNSSGGVVGAEACATIRIPQTKSLVIDTDGNVLANKLQDFSEEDALTVVAMGPKSAIAGLKVTRRSAFRDVTVLRVLGDTSAVVGKGKESATAKTEEIVCKRFQLADFSSGRGAIGVSNAAATVDTEIEFSVRARYHGMFTVGYIASGLNQPEFILRQENGITTVQRKPSEATKLGFDRTHFALMYSAFIPLHDWSPNTWSKRGWNQAFSASAGVLLDDLENKNVLLGVNFGPVNGFSLAVGFHIGEVQRLAAGLVNGSAIDATDAADIPLDTKLSASYFLGINLDIRVATKLFFSLFTKN